MLPKLVSWSVATVGFGIGLVALAWVGFSGAESRWQSVAGLTLLALTFLLGSWIAVWNRRIAAGLFLAAAPLGSVFLAHPGSELLALAVFLFLPLLVAFLGRHRPMRAILSFAATSGLTIVTFLHSPWTFEFLTALAGWLLLYIAFGSFWWGSQRRQWPQLRSNPRTFGNRLATTASLCVAIVCVNIALTLVFSALWSFLFIRTCEPGPLIFPPLAAGRAVFQARILLVGRSLETIFRSPFEHDPRLGSWAVGLVEEDFGGLHIWERRLVLLTDFLYWKSESYFVDARRADGWVPRLLPIFSANAGCSRTRPAAEAIVDLRVLRKPSKDTRLIGTVRAPPEGPETGWLREPRTPRYSTGTQVRVTGESGDSRIVAADESGVYQVDGLPEGNYTLDLLTPDGQIEGRGPLPVVVHLEKGKPAGYNFELFWNGSIEGRVVDTAGRPAPAPVWIRADGREAISRLRTRSATDGRYRIEKIPPGRYTVMLNLDGPTNASPYDIQAFPKTLEITQGQQITGIDFVVAELPLHRIEAQVLWPEGREAASAKVCIAYENTRMYEPLDQTSCNVIADKDGSAIFHLYGKSRVRVFASSGTQYSRRIEHPADQMPSPLKLVLDSQKP